MTEKIFTREELSGLRSSLSGWLESDPTSGVYRLDRDVFRNEEIFELEMRYIFEGGWVYLAHESQVPEPNDFLTTHIGRQSVILTRTASGEISCLVNACSHRGARVCRVRSGKRRNFTCSFHGWVYDNRGNLLDIRAQDVGAYHDAFDKNQLSLPKAKVGLYRGFIFASLNWDVPPLEEYLTGATDFIDLMLDQSPNGEMEIVPGCTTYVYNGNWKLAAENGVDGYHGPTVHGSYITVAARRASSDHGVKVLDLSALDKTEGGFYYFGNGHAAMWTYYLNYENRPNFPYRDSFITKFGENKTKWMIERSRNLLLYPNVFMMDTVSNQIRIIRPISVDKTEITTYCIAPVGEPAADRRLRIRQYEDFFNATGLATPDDLAEFENCQKGFESRASRWSDLSRGLTRWKTGTDHDGFQARISSPDNTDEGIYVGMYEDWITRMDGAIGNEFERAI